MQKSFSWNYPWARAIEAESHRGSSVVMMKSWPACDPSTLSGGRNATRSLFCMRIKPPKSSNSKVHSIWFDLRKGTRWINQNERKSKGTLFTCIWFHFSTQTYVGAWSAGVTIVSWCWQSNAAIVSGMWFLENVDNSQHVYVFVQRVFQIEMFLFWKHYTPPIHGRSIRVWIFLLNKIGFTSLEALFCQWRTSFRLPPSFVRNVNSQGWSVRNSQAELAISLK